jgi:hypothetical protein
LATCSPTAAKPAAPTSSWRHHALLAILGKISDTLMAAIEQRSLAWRDGYA